MIDVERLNNNMFVAQTSVKFVLYEEDYGYSLYCNTECVFRGTEQQMKDYIDSVSKIFYIMVNNQR